MKKFKKLVIPLILIMTLVVMTGCGDKEKEQIDEVEEVDTGDIAEDFEEPVTSDVRSDDNPATNPEVETAEYNEYSSIIGFNDDDFYQPAPGMMDVFNKYYFEDYFVGADLPPNLLEAQLDLEIYDYFDMEGYLSELGYENNSYSTSVFTALLDIETGSDSYGSIYIYSFNIGFLNKLGQNQVRYKIIAPSVVLGVERTEAAIRDDMTCHATKDILEAVCNVLWNARTTQNPLRDTYIDFYISAYYPDSPFEDAYLIREDYCKVETAAHPQIKYKFYNVAWYY